MDDARHPDVRGMSNVPEDMQRPPPAKPKLSPQERRRRWEERLAALRLRMAIGRELDERGIAEPAAVGAALGMTTAEASKLLNTHRWREGDVALLGAAAARLGLTGEEVAAGLRHEATDPQRPS